VTRKKERKLYLSVLPSRPSSLSFSGTPFSSGLVILRLIFSFLFRLISFFLFLKEVVVNNYKLRYPDLYLQSYYCLTGYFPPLHLTFEFHTAYPRNSCTSYLGIPRDNREGLQDYTRTGINKRKIALSLRKSRIRHVNGPVGNHAFLLPITGWTDKIWPILNLWGLNHSIFVWPAVGLRVRGCSRKWWVPCADSIRTFYKTIKEVPDTFGLLDYARRLDVVNRGFR